MKKRKSCIKHLTTWFDWIQWAKANDAVPRMNDQIMCHLIFYYYDRWCNALLIIWTSSSYYILLLHITSIRYTIEAIHCGEIDQLGQWKSTLQYEDFNDDIHILKEWDAKEINNKGECVCVVFVRKNDKNYVWMEWGRYPFYSKGVFGCSAEVGLRNCFTPPICKEEHINHHVSWLAFFLPITYLEDQGFRHR